MSAQTSMLHVRVNDQLKAQATDALSGVPTKRRYVMAPTTRSRYGQTEVR